MEVILLEKVENLGNLGDKVRVRSGYARNFLLPKGKAKFATEANIAEFEARRAELEKMAAESLATAEARRDKFEAASISITALVGGEGKLFGSIGPGDVAEAAQAAGLDLEKREVRMPDGPLRMAGEFEIALQLHTDVKATLKVTITAEE
ncbi:LSU ribosomal protein L9P [Ectothiorhodosinus mongolicus]|uniref:Large ribosomal subunit protein bL9 n=1 Tax=Ectothiorhodosinus mongolicus TaxID=233100 RepID=A0A1R3W4H9_9GAMM|nr:50S ribosomal protein L9 [Ectothiorhodosinus mongolicus]ULX57494.1 50S ribosomal protein L9 [Ectothiorhodosinus mongolicus]SIT72471.1 LSU ribosomal protein L9P [Ectothiorhodosinus mongolicus]